MMTKLEKKKNNFYYLTSWVYFYCAKKSDHVFDFNELKFYHPSPLWPTHLKHESPSFFRYRFLNKFHHTFPWVDLHKNIWWYASDELETLEWGFSYAGDSVDYFEMIFAWFWQDWKHINVGTFWTRKENSSFLLILSKPNCYRESFGSTNVWIKTSFEEISLKNILLKILLNNVSSALKGFMTELPVKYFWNAK